MRVAIASDHAGFEQKEQLKAYIADLGHEVVDYGPASDDRCDYSDYADIVARAVARGEHDRGVLVCGTGIGMALTADKVAGIRAAILTTPEFAQLFREHNDGNVICLSGRFTPYETNCAILDTFFTTEFSGGRHEGRVEKIMREDDPAFGGVDPASF